MAGMTARAAAGLNARKLAHTVLMRVWSDDAFASRALDAELARVTKSGGDAQSGGLARSEAGLATALVYGVLRTTRTLDQHLLRHSDGGRLVRTLETLVAMRIGAFSLLFFDHVPAYAAVETAVELIPQPETRAYVNAVLRALANTLARTARPQLGTAIQESVPPHLMGALRKSLGRAGARAIVQEAANTPKLSLALRDSSSREAVSIALRAAFLANAQEGADVVDGTVSPFALNLSRGGDLRALPGWQTDWIAQEEGAQLVALATDAKAGERILDACAGRGTKSWLLRAMVGATGQVDVAERYPRKLEEMAAGPIDAMVNERFSVDWTVGAGAVPQAAYDCVLVDSPCTGTGTLRRRPEIMLRWEHEGVPDWQAPTVALAELQWQVLRQAACASKADGRLVYAVCSVLQEEGEAIVKRLVAEGDAHGRSWRLETMTSPSVRALFGDVATLRLLPHVHGTDGYFVAMLRCVDG
jgi:16S rRNA (cytosine967-C5)-methyltransferase